MTAAAIAFAALFTLLSVGVPIGFGLILVGTVGFAVVTDVGPALSMLAQNTVDTVLSYHFSVLPMFLLMGNVIARTKLAEELYDAANAFLGHARGGLAHATVISCGAFGAVCGSSMATTATMCRIAVPTMLSRGYAPSLTIGSVAAGGTLGILIPPSVALVLYGLITENDIGALFIAGIVPGILGVLLYMAAIAATVRLRRGTAPAGAARAAWGERLRALTGVWSVLLLFGLVMGGIYGGAFTPTEAASIGAAGALIIAGARGALSLHALYGILMETARTTAMLFVVLIGAIAFTNFLNVGGLAGALSGAILGLEADRYVVLLAIIGIYILLGCFLDSIAMMLLTVPIFYPVVVDLGFDPIWFGIIVVVVIEIGLISPPFGMNVFVARSIVRDVPIVTIFRGVMPFLAADAVRLALLVAFPGLSLFLVATMA